MFSSKSHMFTNVLSWTLATTKLVMSVHYFTCGWIAIYQTEQKERQKFFSDDSNMGVIYVESFYFMTATISTVGFGDLSVFDLDTTSQTFHSICMVYILFVITAGLMLFSAVRHQLLRYDKLKTVDELVIKSVRSMEAYLIEI